MDAVACIVCAALAAACAWSLPVWASDEQGFAATGAGLDVRLRAVAHALRRALRAVGSSRVCVGLMSLEAFGAAVDELVATLAGEDVQADETEAAGALVVGSVAACALVGLLARSAFVALAAAPLVVAAYPARLARRTRAQAAELAEQMPAVLRTLATAMGSGHTLMQALDYVGINESGPAGEAFGRASLRLRCGMPAENALERLAAELDAPGCELMATALCISQRTGSPLRDLLTRSALLVEQQGELQRTLAVKTAQVRLSVRVVCVLPVAMVVLLSLISPDFRQGLATPGGIACLLAGALMDACALMAIRTILKGVL